MKIIETKNYKLAQMIEPSDPDLETKKPKGPVSVGCSTCSRPKHKRVRTGPAGMPSIVPIKR